MTVAAPRTRARPTPAVAPRARPAAAAVPNPLLTGELAANMASVTRTYGQGVITRADMTPSWKHIPTGIFSLDIGMLGGLPEGLATLGYGWEHSGKSTMGYKMIGQAQKKYPSQAPVLIDIEGTYMPEWGAVQGIDNERLVLVQPETGEQALDIAVAMLRSAEVSCLMVDSLAGLIPKAVLDKSFEDADVGTQAKMIARFCSVVQSVFLAERHRGHRVAMYLVNQWRNKIGVIRGDPRVLPGGLAQHYLAALKVEFKNKEQEGRDAEGHQQIDHNDHAFTIKKNKIGVAAREGEFLMVRNPDHPLGQGFIDDARAVVTWGKAVGYHEGGGNKQRFRHMPGQYPTLQAIADAMYDDMDLFEHIKHELICDYRETKGLAREFL